MLIQNERDRPKQYIDRVLDMLWKKKKTQSYGIDILEIGCMRRGIDHHPDITTYECCNDGHSTFLFARTGWFVTSVDISKDAIDSCRWCCSCMSHRVTFINDDAINFANKYVQSRERVGLLFLDAWDLETPGYAESHLLFYNIIKPVLNTDCMVLIDDTDLTYNADKKEYFKDPECLSGKGRLLIPQMLRDGYEIVFKGRQTLLEKVANK